MRKYLARVLISFDSSSKLDWVLLWLMVYLVLLTVSNYMAATPPVPAEAMDHPGVRFR